jgi:hypothetical protein
MIAWILVLSLADTALLRHTFESGTSGWIALGKGATLQAADRALVLDYSVGDGIALAALPLLGADVSKMDAIRFWMKTDVPTGLAVIINEKKPGGDYTAICWSTGNTWQQVQLTPADFRLNAGPKDPVDPDGKLDLDAIQNMGVLDIRTIVAVKVDPGSPIVMESHEGKHSFSIREFELVTGSGAAAREKTTIDSFATPQLQWLTLGGVELKPEGSGMRAVYQQVDDRSVAMVRQIAGVDLRAREGLAFDIASEKPAQLVLSFEELAPGKQQGPRHNLEMEVPGGGKVEHREVLLSAFDQGDGTIDLGKLKTFSILDTTGNFTHETAKNSLWIGNIRAVGDAARQ